ncbi:hypothetical protein ACERK3_16315 [Phycisphaerales bacterium AB-hyl4]|uniref:Uncharacterized protein n=1 Tax=Natronomicrosphaera hydrolytica TaxID=3242702 RepID=A0ABV4U8C2_9BACT
MRANDQQMVASRLMSVYLRMDAGDGEMHAECRPQGVDVRNAPAGVGLRDTCGPKTRIVVG